MEIHITPEMLEAARAKQQADKQLEEITDPGTENICLSCE